MKKWHVGLVLMCLAVGAIASQAGIIDEDFTTASFGTGAGDWYNKQAWEINNAAGRAEYNGGAANGWQWFEKSVDPAAVANGWELTFDYEWMWGDSASWCQMRAEVVSEWSRDEAANGYALLFAQGGTPSFILQKIGSDASSAMLDSGAGYSDSGCQWGSPVWKTVKLTWDNATDTLTAYKKVNGDFVEVCSAVDGSLSSFNAIRFNEMMTAGEKSWITNVHFAAVPEPMTLAMLAMGGIATMMRRRR